MVLGRYLAVGSLVLVTGCASMNNTLAQDRVWKAWSLCQYEGRISNNVQLIRVEPDGRYWYQWLNGSHGAAELTACMSEKIAAQRVAGTQQPIPPSEVQNGAAPVSKGTVVPAAAKVTSPVVMGGVPTWKRGDEWAYRYESPTGNGTYVWSVDREEAIDGVPHYVIKTGTREIFSRRSDLAATLETVDGVVVLRNTPSRLRYVWPMQVGRTSESSVVEEHPVARQTVERIDTVTVEAEETVTVPAGTFKTLKVVCRNKKTGATRFEAWYSLEVKQIVKLRENLVTGLRTRELIAFKLG
jgi:hypothetical protein